MRTRGTTAGLLVLDLAAVVALFNLVAFVRGAPAAGDLVVAPLWLPALLLVAALYLIDGYAARTDMLSVDYASLHTVAVLGAMVGMLLLTFVIIGSGYELQSSRLVIALSYTGLVPVTLAYRRVIHLRHLAKRDARAFIYVGDRDGAVSFRAECERMGARQEVILAGACPPPSANAGVALPCHELETLLTDMESGRLAVESIVVRESARELTPELSQRLVQLYFAGIPTYTLELFHELYWRKIPLYRLNQTWLFQQGFDIAREPVFEHVKRASDIALSLFGLIVSAPLIAAAAVAVWLEDRGPVLFAQARVGRNQVRFRVYKIRTMRSCGTANGSAYTQPRDARVTRVGRFLRATRLDELPQLWNVLRGEMSLIGPRAEWDVLVETYQREIPCYHFRHLVRPGITGWAQVNYPYGASLEDSVRKLEYDLYYIRHFSFLLDAAIVLKTIHLMLLGKGR